MAILGLRRTTLVDAAVNLIPLAILVFFLVFFLAYDPWQPGLLGLILEIGLLLIPIVVLLLATGVAAWLIQQDEDDIGD